MDSRARPPSPESGARVGYDGAKRRNGPVAVDPLEYLLALVVVPASNQDREQVAAFTGISFVDSRPLAVCKNPRIHQHQVFAGLVQRGKNSVGWFFGFKLHLIINHHGELLAGQLTTGNTDDRQPLPETVRGLVGKLIGDKGYPF